MSVFRPVWEDFELPSPLQSYTRTAAEGDYHKREREPISSAAGGPDYDRHQAPCLLEKAEMKGDIKVLDPTSRY